jgi:hypothetical protein
MRSLTMMRNLCALVVALAASACGGSNGSPAAPTPSAPAPTPQTFTLTGRVTSTSGAAIGSATVRISDGANTGRSTTTSGSGDYSLTGLAASGFTVVASATNYVAVGKGVTLTSSQTVDFQLTPTPLFTRTGTGDTVFDMPTTVSRIRITGTYRSNSSNFIVRIGGRLVVNELLGTFWGPTVFDGTYVTSGGVVEITNSSGVAWTFVESR